MKSPISLEALRAAFPSLAFESPADGVLELVIANEGRQNSATESMHRDLANVWRAIDAEAGVRAVVVRGAGEPCLCQTPRPCREQLAIEWRMTRRRG